eukprot:12422506-Karenia_brevis.AAC.1
MPPGPSKGKYSLLTFRMSCDFSLECLWGVLKWLWDGLGGLFWRSWIGPGASWNALRGLLEMSWGIL